MDLTLANDIENTNDIPLLRQFIESYQQRKHTSKDTFWVSMSYRQASKEEIKEEAGVQLCFSVKNLFSQFLDEGIEGGVIVKSPEELKEHLKKLKKLKSDLSEWKIDWNRGIEVRQMRPNKAIQGKPFEIILNHYYEEVVKYSSNTSGEKGCGDIIYIIARSILQEGIRLNYEIIEKIPWLKQLIQSHDLLKPYEGEEPYAVKWVQSLDVTYGRKLVFSSANFLTEKDHYLLEYLTRMPKRDHKKVAPKEKGDPNLAHAGISLIVKDPNVLKSSPDYIRKFYLPLGDENARQAQMTTDDAKKVSERISKARSLDGKIETPRLVRFDHEKYPPLITEDLGQIGVNDTKFHHSEQEIYNYLEDPLNLRILLQDFKKEIEALYPAYRDGFSERLIPLKPLNIVAFILHVHSEKYMCENCQVGAIGFQHTENFRRNLKDAVESKEVKGLLVLNNLENLAFFMLVSTHLQFPKEARERFEPERGTEQGRHREGVINIKLMRDSTKFFIFSKDTRTGCLQSHSPFYSRLNVAKAYNKKFAKPRIDESKKKDTSSSSSCSSSMHSSSSGSNDSLPKDTDSSREDEDLTKEVEKFSVKTGHQDQLLRRMQAEQHSRLETELDVTFARTSSTQESLEEKYTMLQTQMERRVTRSTASYSPLVEAGEFGIKKSKKRKKTQEESVNYSKFSKGSET